MYMDRISTPTVSRISRQSHAFERARDAVLTLQDSRSALSPQDEETLGILIDDRLMGHLATSMREAKQGKVEPLESILDE